MRFRLLPLTGQKIHFLVFGFVSLLLFPAARYAHIQIAPSRATVFSSLAYFIDWVVLSTLWAAGLYQLGMPGTWGALAGKWQRFIPTLILGALCIRVLGLQFGLPATLFVFILIEFSFRKGSWRRIGTVFLLWFYLSAGIKIAFAFSSIIVTLRPCTEFDRVFSRIDTQLMHGWTVVQISQHSAHLYAFASVLYYGVFGVMGAGILILCLADDVPAATRLSGAILVAFFLSLAIFYFVPAQGPFLSSAMPAGTLTGTLQRASISGATRLYHHSGWVAPETGYYVAFPSLHMVQPLVVAWYLRRWRAVSAILLFYAALVVPAILILRWHYLTDILGGIAVAAIAVGIVSIGSGKGQQRVPGENQTADTRMSALEQA